MEAPRGLLPDWQKVVPYGFGALVFHYGDPYLIKHTPDDRGELLPPAFASGPTRQPFWLKPTGKTGTITVNLYPGALWKILRIDMNANLGKVTDLSDVFGIRLQTVLQKSGEATGQFTRAGVIMDFLIRETEVPAYDYDEVDLAVSMMRAQQCNGKMFNLAGSLNISMSKLERHFRQKVGFSPKTYYNILRFNNIFSLLKEHPSLDLHDIAYLSGYYDQSHFIKDFSRFAGETPRSFFKRENHAVAVYSGK